MGYFVLKWTVPDGTYYVVSLAWCGCTTFDQTLPEGVHFMGLASCFFLPSNWRCTHCGVGVAYFHSNKLYLMVKISWHEFNVVWRWLFSQMSIPDGVQVVWIWCGCGFCLLSLCYFRHEAVKFCLLCCCMRCRYHQFSRLWGQCRWLCELLTMLRGKLDCTEGSPNTLCM